MQLQGDFELNADGMGAIRQLLEKKLEKRHCSNLHAHKDGCLHQFECPQGESAALFIQQASLLDMTKALRMARKTKKRLSDSEWRLHMLRFDIVAAVASFFPFALYGDCTIFIVGQPWIKNHFFSVAIVKTTDGLGGAVLDLFKGDYDIQLTKDCLYSKREHTDLLFLLQAFLAINDHILLPEYSITDRRRIIGKLEFHFPEAYTQPSSSNACWLYSIAVIEQLYLQLPDLIRISDNTSAHNSFDAVALAVSSIFSDFSKFEVWVKDLKTKHWDSKISGDDETVEMAGEKHIHYFDVGEVDKSLDTALKWKHSIADYGVSAQLFSSTLADGCPPAMRKLFGHSSTANRNSLARNNEFENQRWQSNLTGTLEALKLSIALPDTGLEKIADSDSRCLVAMTQRIFEFGRVLKAAKLHTQACGFLDDPGKSSSVKEGCVFMRCEQNWPQYNNGQGGADLVLSALSNSTNIHGDPKQVVIFHATHGYSFLAGKSSATKSSVNGAQSNNFYFCAVPDNCFAKYYQWFLLVRDPKACNSSLPKWM